MHKLILLLIFIYISVSTNAQHLFHISVFSHYPSVNSYSSLDSTEKEHIENRYLHGNPGMYIIHDTLPSLILSIFEVDSNKNRNTLLKYTANLKFKECYLLSDRFDSTFQLNLNIINEIRIVGFKAHKVHRKYKYYGDVHNNGNFSLEVSNKPTDPIDLYHHNKSALPYQSIKKFNTVCYWFSKMNLNNNCYITLGYGRKLRKIKVFKVDNIKYRKVKIDGVDTTLYDLYSYQINGYTFQNYNYIVLCKNNRHLRRYEKYNSKYLVPSCD